MADTLKNRGPDASGGWWHDEFNVGLGHRRLSIIDLSTAGDQPMRSASGRYTITYNGEIFNYRDLQKELEPATWRGHSDTEIMLAAFDRWGIEASASRFNGQFAFAVWDERERRLTLVRDRIGIKPLYYGWLGGTFVFGSELDAIRAHPRFEPEVNPRAVVSLLELGYIPAPLSVYKQISKLRPGTMISLSSPGQDPTPRPFWSMSEVANRTGQGPDDPEEAADELDSLIRDSVSLRLMADVPVGAFLSGGIDSSLVCGVMRSVSTGPVKTYSIGFEDARFDEAPFAEKVAAHLGTDHTNLYVSPEEAMNVLPDIPGFYDEPFADASQIPTYLVSKLARSDVKVSLSGDGGDELFGGYERYDRFLARWSRLSKSPAAIRWLMARTSRAVSDLEQGSLLPAIARRAPRVLNRRVGYGQASRALSLLGARTSSDFYRRSISLGSTGFAGPALQNAISHSPVADILPPDGLDMLREMTYIDTLLYLPDDILVKVDRASMAVSLEARVPLLDHRVVEFAWSLDSSLKIRQGDQKWLLKRVLERYVPPSLTERPKMGFAVPIGSWIKGPLRDWAESLIGDDALAKSEVFDSDAVSTIWKQHVSEQADVHTMLWRILMYQAWMKTTTEAPVVCSLFF
jgi:asparagine synthase (glutamine-hydrolysing)